MSGDQLAERLQGRQAAVRLRFDGSSSSIDETSRKPWHTATELLRHAVDERTTADHEHALATRGGLADEPLPNHAETNTPTARASSSSSVEALAGKLRIDGGDVTSPLEVPRAAGSARLSEAGTTANACPSVTSQIAVAIVAATNSSIPTGRPAA